MCAICSNYLLNYYYFHFNHPHSTTLVLHFLHELVLFMNYFYLPWLQFFHLEVHILHKESCEYEIHFGLQDQKTFFQSTAWTDWQCSLRWFFPRRRKNELTFDNSLLLSLTLFIYILHRLYLSNIIIFN